MVPIGRSISRIQICLIKQGRYICCLEYRRHQAFTQRPIEELDQEVGVATQRRCIYWPCEVDFRSAWSKVSH